VYYQPPAQQLRSKTPTTDKLLFKSSQSQPNATMIPVATNQTTNDYLYLNSQKSLASLNANNNHIQQQKPQSQSQLQQNTSSLQNNNTNGKQLSYSELYSTVSKSTKSINGMVENEKEPLDSIKMQQQQHQVEHTPIYDTTTNLQHQRVIQNLNKFNNYNHQHQQNQSVQMNMSANQQQQQQQQQFNPLVINRSKTPGPDMIYFRNTSTADANSQLNGKSYGHHHHHHHHHHSQYQPQMQANFAFSQQQHEPIYPSKAATISVASGQQINLNYLNRSKTPTADIMYYPMSGAGGGSLNGAGVYNKQRINITQFENIYQPFNKMGTIPPQSQVVYDGVIGDYAIDELNGSNIVTDVDGNNYIEMVIDLYRGESGFGFRIVGGEEEGSQVSIGYIVQGGAAHLDGRLRVNDEIVMIDNELVIGATHRRVVHLMTIAGLNRVVKLMIRRRLTGLPPHPLPQLANMNSNQQRDVVLQQQHQQQHQLRKQIMQQQQATYPYTITLFRNGNEGFGFVIISTLNKNGPSIGKSLRLYFNASTIHYFVLCATMRD
jgi:hypothetical protein